MVDQDHRRRSNRANRGWFVCLPSSWPHLVSPAAPPSAFADNPRAVKNSVLQRVTDNDGKPGADVFTVTIANGEGKILARVFDTKEEIKPFTTFNLWPNRLRAVAGPGDTKWTDIGCQGRSADAELRFRPADKWHRGPFVLQAKGSQ